MQPPRRIAILGNAGTGKSTLAVRLSRRLGLPLVHLDQLLWRPGWKIVPHGEFERAHRHALAGEEWIIEGIGHPSTISARVDAAELVVLLRYPLWRCYWWALKREIGPGGAAGRPADCPMLPALGRLIAAIWRTQRDILPDLERQLEQLDRPVRVLRSPRELPRLLREMGAGVRDSGR